MPKIAAGIVIATAASLAASLPQTAVARDEPPRLVLQITVDQLRGDLPGRYLDRYGDAGFRYLFDHGTVYADAHHAHANTETIVGHTTLATGAYPSAHGMIGNIWFDRSVGRDIYNVQDERYPLLTEDAGVDADTEIDPTQRAATTDGRSPAAILVSIFAGAGVPARVVYRRIETVDVARTIAAFVGAKPPSGAFGNVLHEVLERTKDAAPRAR